MVPVKKNEVLISAIVWMKYVYNEHQAKYGKNAFYVSPSADRHLRHFCICFYVETAEILRNKHGQWTMDWFKIGKGIHQGCMLSPCLFNLYADIMWNDGLDEAQGGIKIAGKNINNLRYADDTTFMEESEEKLKSLLMKFKYENEKSCLKLNIQKTKIMVFSSITSWQIDGETVETVTDYFLGLQNHCRWWLQPWN